MDKEEKKIYDINISGDGGNQVAHEISSETYEYFSKNNELLINHIVYNEEVPDDEPKAETVEEKDGSEVEEKEAN